MKRTLFYKKLKNKEVRCQICFQRCLIKPGKRGICGIRENIQGSLYVLNYGKIAAQNIDPIEKKPLYHFLPKTSTFSIASVGCNLRCLNCQNWQISQSFKFKKEISGKECLSQEFIESALKNDCPSISYTYTEPTVFAEFALETMKLARKNNLKNIWITNGLMSQKTLKAIIPFLDAVNVDLKSFDNNFYKKYCQGKLSPVLKNLKEMKKKNVWIEITTLIIPELTDDEIMLEKIAQFIKNKLGPETPWHVLRFFPEISWKLKNLPITPTETIEKTKKIGLKLGLKHVY